MQAKKITLKGTAPERQQGPGNVPGPSLLGALKVRFRVYFANARWHWDLMGVAGLLAKGGMSFMTETDCIKFIIQLQKDITQDIPIETIHSHRK